MSDIAMDAARLLEMLPESEQHFAYELITVVYCCLFQSTDFIFHLCDPRHLA